jgi:SAM-dependent methyltransferase
VAEFNAFASGYRELVDQSVRFTGESSAFFAAYKANYVARKVVLQAGCKVLDYGCGVGLLSQELKKALNGVRVDGFDPSADSLSQVDGGLRREGTFTSSVNELDRGYDAVVLANVLHHVAPANRAAAVQQASSRLSPGGKLVVFEHNPLNPLTRRAVAECPFDKGVTLLPRGELVGIVRASGLQVLSQAYIVFFPRWLAWLRRLEPTLWWCPAGAQYAVIAGRRKGTL